jgi:hypothetical protein
MLGFKSLSTDLYVKEGVPFNGNLVFFSGVSLAGNASWKSLPGTVSRFVRGSNYANVGTFLAATVFTNTTLTTSSTGSHSDLTTPISLYNLGAATKDTATGTTTTSGAHTHTLAISSSFANVSAPIARRTGMYQSNNVLANNKLPAGILVFSLNKPSEDYVSNSAYNDCHLFGATNESGYGGTQFTTNTYSTTLTTSSSGGHVHIPAGTACGDSGINDINQPRYNGGLGAGPTHSHTQSITSSPKLKSLKLRLWQTVRPTTIANGVITGFVGTSSGVLPTDWYLCNGQTVKGFTTPDLTSNYILCSNTEHNVVGNPSTLLNFNMSFTSFNWVHTHSVIDTWWYAPSRATLYHGTISPAHTHTVIQDSGWQPDTYCMAFVIYLP